MITQTENTAPSQDFARLVELQQRHTASCNSLDELEALINKLSQAAVKMRSEEYVVLQESIAQDEAAINALFRAHPEWRGDQKSVKTPFGTVQQQTVTELEVPNPAATVTLIELEEKTDPSFKAAEHLHVEKRPNLEALEKYTTEKLAKFGVTRKSAERITVKPAKVNVSKAVKAAAKKKETK